MHELKKNYEEIFQLLSCLDVHIGIFQSGMTVAASSLRSQEHGRINNSHRTEITVGTAEFVPVLPDRPAFFNDYIVYRTNHSAGAA